MRKGVERNPRLRSHLTRTTGEGHAGSTGGAPEANCHMSVRCCLPEPPQRLSGRESASSEIQGRR